jgi:hypothetical protein
MRFSRNATDEQVVADMGFDQSRSHNSVVRIHLGKQIGLDRSVQQIVVSAMSKPARRRIGHSALKMQ